MRSGHAIREQLKEHGFANGSKFVSIKETCYDELDLEILYDRDVYKFSPNHEPIQHFPYPNASFMGLPTELRLQILRHLLPDERDMKVRDLEHRRRPTAAINAYRDAKNGKWHRVAKRKREEKFAEWETQIKDLYSALRKDLEECSPAILSVNRQLYAESAQIMYGGRTFHGELNSDVFSICSRHFRLVYHLGPWDMLESQLRHVEALRVTIDADEEFCPVETQVGHDCKKSGCSRRRIDGIRNLAEFLAESVGLKGLEINVRCSDFFDALEHPTTSKREQKRLGEKVLHFIEPFASARRLAWAEIQLMGEDPRDVQNISSDFCNKIREWEKIMCDDEASVPRRTDLPFVKGAFDTILLTNTEHRSIIRSQIGLDVDDIAEKCWEACEAGNKSLIMKHRREMLKAWVEHKRLVDGMFESIESMCLDTPSVSSKPKGSSRKGKTAAAVKR